MTKEQLHIVDAQKEYYISLDEILFVSADGNYCDIYMVHHTVYKSIRIQLGQLWTKMEEKGKMVEHHLERISRSYIINMKYIQHVNPKKGLLILHTDKDVELKIPKAAAKEFVKLIGKKQDRQVVIVYANKRKLSVPRNQLNDEMTFEKGRMYVDLGLSSGTMWATMNVGEGGLFLEPYFAWGALSEYNTYSKARYKYRTEKENLLEKSSLSLRYDIARQHWGGRWRMPSLDEFRELANECVMTWCSLGNRRRAILVTGRNGNKIVLPVVGYYKEDEIREDGFAAHYWTSTIYADDTERAWSMFFVEDDDPAESTYSRIDPKNRFLGLGVRPVFSPEDTVEVTEPIKKKVIIFHEYFPDYSYDNTDEYPHALAYTCLKAREWIVIEKKLPMNPDEAMKEVEAVCSTVHPDIVVGITTACVFCNQLTDCVQVLVDPTQTASMKLREHINYGVKAGDADEIVRREELIKQFEQFEETHPLVPSSKGCWIGLKKMAENKIEGCNYVRLQNFVVLARWRRVFLYPLLLKIVNHENVTKELSMTDSLNESCDQLMRAMRRVNEAVEKSHLEVDDEF
jgi:hypothetical protein